VSAVSALQRADLIINIGARFDDRVTGRLDSFAPKAKVVHVDIDPAEISKNKHADVAVIGEAAKVATALTEEIRARVIEKDTRDYTAWWSTLENLRDTYPLGWTETADGFTAPQKVISRIGAISGPESIFVAGVGQHQMWSSQFIRYERPNSWINSGGLGTMGYSVPAAMGAKVGSPDRAVWAIDGDGCFQMTNQELATCVINDIPLKVAIINNSSLGMVRQWQNLFYDQRYSHTDLNTGHGTRRVPDFVKLADAYGCAGLRCERDEDIDATIEQAMEINDRPVVVDFQVSADAMVWPMVPAGVSNDEIQIAQGLSPEWERDI
jgi:acetolactate synthase-1/2/3 large subunit